MKNFIQKIILLIACVAIFYTGAGVTIINYCCNSCIQEASFIPSSHTCCTEGADITTPMSCCSSKEKAAEATDCNETIAKDMHCSTSRLSIDIDASIFKPLIIVPFIWLDNASEVSPFSIASNYGEHINGDNLFESNFSILPRAYLSLIRILII